MTRALHVGQPMHRPMWVRTPDGEWVLLSVVRAGHGYHYDQHTRGVWEERARLVREREGWVRHVVGLPLHAASRTLAQAQRAAEREAGAR